MINNVQFIMEIKSLFILNCTLEIQLCVLVVVVVGIVDINEVNEVYI